MCLVRAYSEKYISQVFPVNKLPWLEEIKLIIHTVILICEITTL